MKDPSLVSQTDSGLVGRSRASDQLLRCQNLLERLKSEIAHEDDENYWLSKLGLMRETRNDGTEEMESREGEEDIMGRLDIEILHDATDWTVNLENEAGTKANEARGETSGRVTISHSQVDTTAKRGSNKGTSQDVSDRQVPSMESVDHGSRLDTSDSIPNLRLTTETANESSADGKKTLMGGVNNSTMEEVKGYLSQLGFVEEALSEGQSSLRESWYFQTREDAPNRSLGRLTTDSREERSEAKRPHKDSFYLEDYSYPLNYDTHAQMDEPQLQLITEAHATEAEKQKPWTSVGELLEGRGASDSTREDRSVASRCSNRTTESKLSETSKKSTRPSKPQAEDAEETFSSETLNALAPKMVVNGIHASPDLSEDGCKAATGCRDRDSAVVSESPPNIPNRRANLLVKSLLKSLKKLGRYQKAQEPQKRSHAFLTKHDAPHAPSKSVDQSSTHLQKGGGSWTESNVLVELNELSDPKEEIMAQKHKPTSDPKDISIVDAKDGAHEAEKRVDMAQNTKRGSTVVNADNVGLTTADNASVDHLWENLSCRSNGEGSADFPTDAENGYRREEEALMIPLMNKREASDDENGLAILDENSQMIRQQFALLKSVFEQSRAQSSELLQNVLNNSWRIDSKVSTDIKAPLSFTLDLKQLSKDKTAPIAISEQEERDTEQVSRATAPFSNAKALKPTPDDPSGIHFSQGSGTSSEAKVATFTMDDDLSEMDAAGTLKHSEENGETGNALGVSQAVEVATEPVETKEVVVIEQDGHHPTCPGTTRTEEHVMSLVEKTAPVSILGVEQEDVAEAHKEKLNAGTEYAQPASEKLKKAQGSRLAARAETRNAVGKTIIEIAKSLKGGETAKSKKMAIVKKTNKEAEVRNHKEDMATNKCIKNAKRSEKTKMESISDKKVEEDCPTANPGGELKLEAVAREERKADYKKEKARKVKNREKRIQKKKEEKRKREKQYKQGTTAMKEKPEFGSSLLESVKEKPDREWSRCLPLHIEREKDLNRSDRSTEAGSRNDFKKPISKKMLSWSDGTIDKQTGSEDHKEDVQAVIWWSTSKDAVEVLYENEDDKSSDTEGHSSVDDSSFASYPTVLSDDQTFASEPQIDFSFSTLKEVTEVLVEEAVLMREEMAVAGKDMLRETANGVKATASHLVKEGPSVLRKWFMGGSKKKKSKRRR